MKPPLFQIKQRPASKYYYHQVVHSDSQGRIIHESVPDDAMKDKEPTDRIKRFVGQTNITGPNGGGVLNFCIEADTLMTAFAIFDEEAQAALEQAAAEQA
ncbi:MAG: hypothetical protein ABIG63_22190 [Chloroflexota bacterium]